MRGDPSRFERALDTLLSRLSPSSGRSSGRPSSRTPALRAPIPTTVIRRPSSPPPHYSRSSIAPSPSSSSSTLGPRGSPVCLSVSTPLHPSSSPPSVVRYTLPPTRYSSRRSSLGSCERDQKTMDFDPDGAKWQCCCCNLPTGLKILAGSEVVAASVVAVATVVHIVTSAQVSWFTSCLLAMALAMALGSILLFVGIHTHSPKLLYPSLGARTLLIIFFTVFCGSIIAAPRHETDVETATMTLDENGQWNQKNNIEVMSESLALRLVALVFAMLFFAVLVLYTIYLVLRCVSYERSFSRLRERRESLIHAGMIDPDFNDCRRSSNC